MMVIDTKNIKRYIPLIILFLIPIRIYANEGSVTTEDERISDILSRMSSIYNSYKNFRLEFKYSRTDPDIEDTEEFEGKLIMQGDNKYILSIKENDIITDGITKWIYLKSTNEVTISNYDSEDEDERLLNRIRNTILYPTEWLTPVLYEQKEDIDIIELEPYEEDSQDEESQFEDSSKINRVILEIIHETKELRSWRIETADGVQQTYLITNIEPNIKINKKFFKFDPEKYDGVVISDLR